MSWMFKDCNQGVVKKCVISKLLKHKPLFYTVHLRKALAMLWFTKGKHQQFSKWKYLYLIATFQCSLWWKVMLRFAVPGRWLYWRLVILADNFKLQHAELYYCAYLYLTLGALLQLSGICFWQRNRTLSTHTIIFYEKQNTKLGWDKHKHFRVTWNKYLHLLCCVGVGVFYQN